MPTAPDSDTPFSALKKSGSIEVHESRDSPDAPALFSALKKSGSIEVQ